MKNLITKFFYWIRDHFLVHFVVLFRLHIGRDKKENPEFGSNPAVEDSETEKGN